jgi:hypothetical protein
LGSGQVGQNHLSSGLFQCLYLPTVELISGFRAVCVTSGHALLRAHAGSGLMLPAIGVVAGNYVSGAVAQVIYAGPAAGTGAFDATWSGMAGKPLFVGSGGLLVTFSGLQSGAGYQRMGLGLSGLMHVQPELTVTSGAVTAQGNVF